MGYFCVRWLFVSDIVACGPSSTAVGRPVFGKDTLAASEVVLPFPEVPVRVTDAASQGSQQHLGCLQRRGMGFALWKGLAEFDHG